MTEQHSAGAGQTSARAPRGKSTKRLATVIHEGLTDAGFVQGDDGVYTAPKGFATFADRSAPAEREDEAETTRGHNRKPTESDERLRLLIERIERLEDEKKGIGDDIKDVYAEAKATGYDPAIMRKVIKLRKMKPDDRAEAAALLETYCASLGMDVQPLLL